ncbi:hypothetical protein [Lentibacillus daqui]|nr:hypothetical protein [Lentibacillus daqui]
MALFITSYIVGSWVGMGIGVVSFGMLIFVILASVITAFSASKRKIEE